MLLLLLFDYSSWEQKGRFQIDDAAAAAVDWLSYLTDAAAAADGIANGSISCLFENSIELHSRLATQRIH